SILAVSPGRAGNSGPVTMMISGEGFQDDTAPKLTLNGHPDITATSSTLVSASLLSATFDLTNAATGTWDVVVTNSGGDSAALANGFEIAPASSGSYFVNLIFPTVVRVGGTATLVVE